MFLLKKISIVFLIILQTSFVYGWSQGEATEKTLQELKASIVELTKQVVNLNESSKVSSEKMESLTNKIYWLTWVMVIFGFFGLMQIDALRKFAKDNSQKLLNCILKPFQKKQKQ